MSSRRARFGAIGRGFGGILGAAAAGMITSKIIQQLSSGDFKDASESALNPVLGLGGNGGNNPLGAEDWNDYRKKHPNATVDLNNGKPIVRNGVPDHARKTGPGALLNPPRIGGPLSGAAVSLPELNVPTLSAVRLPGVAPVAGTQRRTVRREQPIGLHLDAALVAQAVARSDEEWEERL